MGKAQQENTLFVFPKMIDDEKVTVAVKFATQV